MPSETNTKDMETVILSDFERGRQIGKYEGMLAYQKRLIENLQKDNEKVNRLLQELKAKK